ncbi:MAG: acyl carrier protein [Oscillospiraceae bacterium]|nr:acyl carrier protein [Oscillospiraceae bacterium]MBQ7006687.1 acyl carrier protein [Oscillospiraceae bacterium]
MTREAIFEELTEIFRDIFDDEEIELTDETTADDIEDWDSLEQINLLVAIEKKFSIKFKLDEVSHLANVGDMVSLVQKLVG